MVDGAEVPRFRGYLGTQVRNEEPQITTLYYHRGEIHTLEEVPNGAMGLIPLSERRRNAALWEEIRRGALSLQREFQMAAGVDVPRQVRFENADHLKVSARSIDILRGDAVHARVWLADNGEIRTKNFHIAADDFQEYHETKTYAVFTGEGKVISKEGVTAVLDEARLALWERPLAEVQEIKEANLDREQKEERQEKIQNQFIIERADNLEIAASDVAQGQRQGLLPSDGLQAADRVRMYAMAAKTASEDEKKFASLGREIDRQVRKIEAVPHGAEHDAERAELEERLAELVGQRESRAKEAADMRDLETALVTSSRVVVAREDKSSVTLAGDGLMMPLRVRRVTKEELDAAAQALSEGRVSQEKKDGLAVPQAKQKGENIEVAFVESPSSYYKDRTRENANKADITIALAVDFTTAGERLTRSVAGDAYLSAAIDAAQLRENPAQAGRITSGELALQILAREGLRKDGGIVINIAGNGQYTLSQRGVSQAAADEYVTALVAGLMKNGVTIRGIRSGGQTGMDEAGIKAAVANSIPAEVLAPRGWKYRGEDGRDVCDEASFKARFEGQDVRREPAESAAEITPEEIDERIAALGKWLSEAERDPILRVTEEFDAKQDEVRDLLKKKEEAKASRKPRRGLPDGVRAVTEFDEQNRVCVVERKQDGRKAYADRQMRIVSGWYDELSPMGKAVGTARRADGKAVKLVTSQGIELTPRWIEGMEKAGDGLMKVKAEGRYNYLDLQKGSLLSEMDFCSAEGFSDGRAVVTNDEGKFNYLKREGGVLCQTWLDSASSFSEGMAEVTTGGNAYRIGTDGKVKEVIQKHDREDNISQGGGIK